MTADEAAQRLMELHRADAEARQRRLILAGQPAGLLHETPRAVVREREGWIRAYYRSRAGRAYGRILWNLTGRLW